ncbi:MarR family transcriptional regulator [Mycobacterium sp. CBMA293]|uniref:MarR family winged helix-turn-helix transcriptional regulator n=1 Tax=unclassified Mycolicibacterium TaxID=2636767 RepID=UPI0012DD3F0B|nr:MULTISPECIES: MarR family transcriptional regulator [unclassified Mycolicibacterium]MUL47300.1 MarR family transcriptional regulator [Mycolicibacterium sp. CBMA 360]MUL61411.1 MarR family transcriptional regulator [Mycolicibacterium sp. CBMA 335]MUL72146.1 MarR family transcriptional regulator [Mycolicibacterium sp. CBMA 311]MUL96313.1 MarR family transcriptional regulator [Mycolicibacterium sp. CBMA 230]MUM08864.1 MarR family transcriptional regulator [Mycolicibacterium sp. CBMA 213]
MARESAERPVINEVTELPTAARSGPVSHAVFQVTRLTRTVVATLLRPLGLHPGQELVMMYLWDMGPLRQTDLVHLTSSDAPTMTRMIQRLEHAGFVRRFPSPDDKRAHLVEATPASRGLQQQIEDIWRQMEEMTVGGLSDQERETVLHVVRGLECRLAAAVKD